MSSLPLITTINRSDPLPSVVAVDPGGCTGAAFRLGGFVTDPNSAHYGSLHSYDEHDIWKLFDQCPEIVVLEDFETGGRVNEYSIHTIRLVGAVMALAHKCEATLCLHLAQNRVQAMDAARTLVTATRRAANQPHVSEVRHQIDATAHLLTWQTVTGWKSPTPCPMIYVPDDKHPNVMHLRTNPEYETKRKLAKRRLRIING